MIRYFRALAWLRWHLVVNSVRPTRKRDAMERASRAFQVLGPILAFLLFVPAILLMGVLGLFGGWSLGSSGSFLAAAQIVLRMVLLFGFVLTILTPLLRAAQGAPRNLTRFLLLPVPARFLYVGEALSGLGDPWLAILTSGLLCLALGWMMAGGVAPALLLLAAAAAILGFLTGLGALSSSFTHLVFRDRRRGEMISLVLLITMAAGGMLPGLLSTFEPSRKRTPDAGVVAGKGQHPESAPQGDPKPPVPAPGPPGKMEWDGRVLPPWAAAYPPELYVRCVALASERRASSAFLPLAILAAWAVAAHGIASRIYRRLLETPEIQSSRRGGNSFALWGRVPGLGPAASAVAMAQVKLIFRTVQGKIALCLPPLVVLVMGTLWIRRPEEMMSASPPVPFGVILAFAGVAFAFMTLEASTLNQFAMDRAGLTLEFLAPVSDRDLIRGKAAGGAILAASRALLCYLAALIIAPGGSPFLWLAVIAGGAAVFFLLAPGGAIISALLPKTTDVGRIGKGGKPHPVASFLGMLCIAAGAGPAVGLVLGALFLFESPALAFLLVAGWAAVAAAISLPLFRLAESLLAQRRENLALVAQGR
jgi:hypothetical protein